MPHKRNTRLNKRPPKKAKAFTQQKQAANDTVSQLRELDDHCRNMIVKAGELAPLLMQKEIIDAGATELIHDQAKIFHDDLINMSQGLDLMTMQIPSKIKPNDNDQLSNALRLSQMYAGWQDKYQSVLVPTIQELTRLLSEAVDAWAEQNPDAATRDVKSAVNSVESDIQADLEQIEHDRAGVE